MRKAGRLSTVFSADVISERDKIFCDLPIDKKLHSPLYDYVFDNKDDNDKVDDLGRPLRHTLYIDKSKTRNKNIVFYKDFDLIEAV